MSASAADGRRSKVHTGIGSRSTPTRALHLMERLAARLAQLGWTLRSGGADGADSAFERGAARHEGACTIFLPWPAFSGAKGIVAPAQTAQTAQTAQRAEAIVSAVHPIWNSLPPPVKALHTRNVYQVLGLELDQPSAFVLCWTPDAAECEASSSRSTGGTRSAIVIAARHAAPVINLHRTDSLTRLAELVNSFELSSPSETRSD